MANEGDFRLEGTADEVMADAQKLQASINRASEIVAEAGKTVTKSLESQGARVAGPSEKEIARGTAAMQAQKKAADELAASLERLRTVQPGAVQNVLPPPGGGTEPARGTAAEYERQVQAQLAAQNAAMTSGAAGMRAAQAAHSEHLARRATAEDTERQAAEMAVLAQAERQLVQEAEAEARAQAKAAAAAREKAVALEQAHARAQVITGAYYTGQGYAAQGKVPTERQIENLTAPKGTSTADAAAGRYALAVGQADQYNKRASLSAEQLTNRTIRLGAAQAETSNALRKHGALTTEFITALARGETTLGELGYQMQATAGKFAGWAVAGAAIYGLFGLFGHLKEGAVDGTNAVEQLHRTIENLDTGRAARAISTLSQGTNVSVKEAGDAVFQFSRSFHSVDEAAQAARQGISVLKLDNVALADSVKLSTAIHQQWGLSVKGLDDVYNMAAAGQREYNARINQMIPLLQVSSGAVRNAGGDLTEYMQIATIFLRQTQLSGNVLGTAFARSAGVRVRQNASAIVSQFPQLGRDIDPLSGRMDWTRLMLDAMRLSTTMAPARRQQLSNLLFDPRLGARIGGAFGPQIAPLLEAVTSGPRAITPDATRGSLQTELHHQLAQVRQQLDAFGNSIQRIGMALAGTGALAPFGALLRGSVVALNGLRQFIDALNWLPGPMRGVVVALVEVRLASLALTRTRMGAQSALSRAWTAIPLPGGRRLPGTERITETRQRAELAVGTRTGMENVSAGITRNIARQNEILADQVMQAQIGARLIAEAGGEAQMDVTQLERLNAIRARILQLDVEAAGLVAEQVAQEATYANLKERHTRLTAVNRRVRYDRAAVSEMSAAVGGGGDAVAMAAATTNTAAQRNAAAAARRMKEAGVLENDALVTSAAQRRALALASNEGAVAMDATAVQTRALTAATAVTEKAGAGLLASLWGFASAFDPLLIGLIALPFVFEGVKKLFDSSSEASQKVKDIADRPATSIEQYTANTRALTRSLTIKPAGPDAVGFIPQSRAGRVHPQQLTRDQVAAIALRDAARPPEPPPIETPSAFVPQGRAQRTSPLQATVQQRVYWRAWQDLADVAAGGRPPQPQRPARPALPARFPEVHGHDNDAYREIARRQANMNNLVIQDMTRLEKAGPNLSQTLSGRARLVAMANRYRDQATALAAEMFVGWPKQLSTADAVIEDSLNRTMQKFTPSGGRGGPTGTQAQYDALFRQLASSSTSVMQGSLSALSSSSTIYGVGTGSMDTAISQLAVLGEQYRNRLTDPQSMQALSSGMSSVTGAFNKQMTDVLGRVKTAPTTAGANTALDQAQSQVDTYRTSVTRWFQAAIDNAHRWGASTQAIGELQAMRQQLLDQANQAEQQVTQQALDQIKSQTELQVARVGGISPEADLRRADLTVQGDIRALQAARARHADIGTVNELMKQLLSDEQSRNKARLDYARDLEGAKDQAWISSDTGIMPHDDLVRAQRTLEAAQRALQRDRAQGRGGPQFWQDLASVQQAQYSLNQLARQQAQQVVQDAEAFIQAQADLAVANTLDPVQAALIQLKADQAKLGTINRRNYHTDQEYQTALMEQRAKIAQDVRNVQSQIVETRTSHLQSELHLQEITDQQYVAGLEQLLKLTKLSQQQRDQIRTAIFDAQHQAAVNLNTANIRLPTTYEVRRSILGAAQRGRGRLPADRNGMVQNNVNHTVNMVVNVHRDADIKKFVAALDGSLRSNFAGTAQAMGLV